MLVDKGVEVDLNVHSIFNSIDGEVNGFAGCGELSTFIRLKGCNFYPKGCKYCDTLRAQNPDPPDMTDTEKILNSEMLEKITITGGEPLMQDITDFVLNLLICGHRVTIETNGSMVISPELLLCDRLRFVVDYKLPSSGMMKRMDPRVFKFLRPVDVVKMVISDMDDYDRACHLVYETDLFPIHTKVAFSPAIRDQKDYTGWPQELAQAMITHKLSDRVQFSLQIHKVLWPYAVEER